MPCIGVGFAQQEFQPGVAAQSDPQTVSSRPTPPVPVSMPAAGMPEEAFRRRQNGACLVSLTIDTHGKPQNVTIVRCSDPMFGPNSINSVKQYRFRPAKQPDGTPIAVTVTLVVEIRVLGWQDPKYRFQTSIYAPPGTASAIPDTDGVYLFKQGDDPPQVVKFADNALGMESLDAVGAACDAVLTVDKNGSASDIQGTHCDKKALEAPATAFLLKARFTPGRVNGAAVPMRVSIRLDCLGYEYDSR
jgi:TonB family protein